MSDFKIDLTLDGQVAVVTGAAPGIGQGVAAAFAHAGADVAILDLDEERLTDTRDLVRAVGRRALPVACDLGDKSAVDDALSTVARELGPCDALVSCAGVICENVPAQEAKEIDMDRL